jgi:hypothetical protein
MRQRLIVIIIIKPSSSLHQAMEWISWLAVFTPDVAQSEENQGKGK